MGCRRFGGAHWWGAARRAEPRQPPRCPEPQGASKAALGAISQSIRDGLTSLFSFFFVSGQHPPVEWRSLQAVQSKLLTGNAGWSALVVRDNDKPPSCPEVKQGNDKRPATEFCQIFSMALTHMVFQRADL